jgi:hypothetical protein
MVAVMGLLGVEVSSGTPPTMLRTYCQIDA